MHQLNTVMVEKTVQILEDRPKITKDCPPMQAGSKGKIVSVYLQPNSGRGMYYDIIFSDGIIWEGCRSHYFRVQDNRLEVIPE